MGVVEVGVVEVEVVEVGVVKEVEGKDGWLAYLKLLCNKIFAS